MRFVHWHILFLLASALLGLQVLVVPYFAINGARPDLLLCLLIYMSFQVKARQALIAGVILGLFKDGISAERFGFFFAMFNFITISLSFLQKKMIHDSRIVWIITTGIASLLVNFAESLMMVITYRHFIVFEQCAGGA